MLALLWVVRAGAGEPLATDNASILEKGVCQFESWHRWEDNDGHEGWGVPACSVHDALEVGIGASYRNERGKHAKLLLQAKSVFWRDPGERWSVGAVAIAVRDYGREQSGFHELAALGLVSFNHPSGTTASTSTPAQSRAAASSRHSPGAPRASTTSPRAGRFWARCIAIRPAARSIRPASASRWCRIASSCSQAAATASAVARGEWFAKFGVRFQSWKLF